MLLFHLHVIAMLILFASCLQALLIALHVSRVHFIHGASVKPVPAQGDSAKQGVQRIYTLASYRRAAAIF